MTPCTDHRIQHVTDDVYRDHEIVICKCASCNNFLVDARSDNFDGAFLGGWIDTNLTSAIIKAVKEIDQHIQNAVELPF